MIKSDGTTLGVWSGRAFGFTLSIFEVSAWAVLTWGVEWKSISVNPQHFCNITHWGFYSHDLCLLLRFVTLKPGINIKFIRSWGRWFASRQVQLFLFFQHGLVTPLLDGAHGIIKSEVSCYHLERVDMVNTLSCHTQSLDYVDTDLHYVSNSLLNLQV